MTNADSEENQAGPKANATRETQPAKASTAKAAANKPSTGNAKKTGAKQQPATGSNSSTLASETLKGFYSEIKRLEEEKAQIGTDISEIYKAAKKQGFDTDAMREVLRREKMTKEEREQREAQIDLYEGVLGLNGEKNEAQVQGIQAASEGQPVTNNPFTKKDPRYTDWSNAWQMQTALMAANGESKNTDNMSGEQEAA
ncbi:DUF2312 domain-containing protein [Roseibium litorale]|uniref:DUF2312 domain-containing protein n=1 Tax=Roseibium litorale TaxID=2803841 RepID=A0ABR9CT16_9HYPH|nr:GapR family DNA-binding domain-containing protein [Roseibium litorale]MBD8894021.1 DUF2312 domain-containing protein [Roseibium litorale]